MFCVILKLGIAGLWSFVYFVSVGLGWVLLFRFGFALIVALDYC